MVIKKIWVLIGSFLLGTPLSASADTAKAAAPQKMDASTPEDDKAALQQAASEADQWAAQHKADEATKGQPSVASSPAPSVKSPLSPSSLPGVAAPTATPKPTPKPAVPRAVGLNELKGNLLSISDDPKTFRLIVEGGYNVEFTYDPKTSVVNGGDPIKVEDLGYNDQLIVRYAGKELYAVEVERVSKAPRPE